MLTCDVYGSSEMSFSTVCRWVRKFSAGMESVKNAPKSGRPKSASCPRIVEKIKRIVKSDARYIFQKTCGHDWNFKSVCIAHSAKYFEIENEKSKVGPAFAHEEAKTARKLLKRFPRYDQIKIMNVVTVYESLIHFLPRTSLHYENTPIQI